MSGHKMQITKEALQLFIKSVPSESTYFQVISFGSEFEYLTDEICPLVYNQDNLEKATERINSFYADMGGTELLNPLKAAIAMDPPALFTGKGYKKMIFMLTDGETENA